MSDSSYAPVVITLPRPRDGGEQHLVSSETNPGVFYLVTNGASRHARCAHPSAHGSEKPAEKCKHIDAVRVAIACAYRARVAMHEMSVTERIDTARRAAMDASKAEQIPAETFQEFRARKAAEAAPAPVPALPARPGRGLYG